MKRSTQQEYTKRILRVLVFLQKNLDEERSLEEYARVAHFSPYHFHRIFRGMVGIGICYDDPEVTAPEKIRYDACVTVDSDFVPQDDIGVQTVGGGEYAVTTHLGPYELLGQTYAQLLGQWLPRSGRELRSEPSLEFYLNTPESTDPEDLITDIYAPLEPAI